VVAEMDAGLQQLAHREAGHGHAKRSFSGSAAAGVIDCIDTGASRHERPASPREGWGA
jgi:hypothetical protein